MPVSMRVAYTLEQCWHAVPGGTAVAALEVARGLERSRHVELVGVAGRHRRAPSPPFAPPVQVRDLPLGRPWLYEAWNRCEWPKVERATGPIDVCHSTTAIPAATGAPHVVTIHDVAFVHAPDRFSRHGARVMRAGLERCRRADLVLCPSRSTAADLVAIGFDGGRIRVVPWGVRPVAVETSQIESLRAELDLPPRFVLFVGTVEPRKNLGRLAQATRSIGVPLVVAGASGWGRSAVDGDGVRFLGFVPADRLPTLYAAADAFAYPSLEEGFGMPVVEAMAQGTPVVTSAGTATEEIAAGAAILVDPTDVTSIGAGVEAALADPEPWIAAGTARAASLSWSATVEATIDAYREVAG